MSRHPVQPCGTPAAYRRHLRAGETSCLACRAANSRAKRDQRDSRRRAATGTTLVSPSAPPAVSQEVAELSHAWDVSAAPASTLTDLRLSRDVLVDAIEATARLDPTRLGPLIRELRETWKALDHATAAAPAPAEDDDFAKARRRRAARRATNTERPL